METQLYSKLYSQEKDYWWSKNKRNYFYKILSEYRKTSDAKILDVGCGTGCLIEELNEMQGIKAFGVDISDESIKFCKQRGIVDVYKSTAENIPFNNDSFDHLVSLDVIEHVENDLLAVSECFRVLKTSGKAIFSVPAHQFLWSDRDTRLMHKKRYSKESFNELLKKAGFNIVKSRYVNLFILPPLFVSILISKLHSGKPAVKTDLAYFSPLLNSLLTTLNSVEYKILDALNVPIGTSIFTVAEKK